MADNEISGEGASLFGKSLNSPEKVSPGQKDDEISPRLKEESDKSQ